MILQLNCKTINNKPLLKWNYKNKIRSLIYEIITDYNPTYAKELHDSKSISTFTFSGVISDSNKKDNFGIHNITNFIIEIRTFDNVIFDSLVNLKYKNLIKMFDSDFIFKVKSVTTKNYKNDLNNYYFISDIITTHKSLEGNKEKILTTDINSDLFKRQIFNNLIKKYKNLTNIETNFDLESMYINVYETKQKYEQIGNNRKLLYNRVKFDLICPVELKKIAYINGIGEKNNSGFGFIKTIKK
jgi:CRISPR-associated endoribonuclease Cas6